MEQKYEVKRLDTIYDLQKYCEVDNLFIWEYENPNGEQVLSTEDIRHMALGGYLAINNWGNKIAYFIKGNKIERDGFKKNTLNIFLNIVRFLTEKEEDGLVATILAHLIANPDPVAPRESLNFLSPPVVDTLLFVLRSYEDTPVGFFKFLSWADYEIYVNTKL